jgi:hypothetical protein
VLAPGWVLLCVGLVGGGFSAFASEGLPGTVEGTIVHYADFVSNDFAAILSGLRRSMPVLGPYRRFGATELLSGAHVIPVEGRGRRKSQRVALELSLAPGCRRFSDLIPQSKR